MDDVKITGLTLVINGKPNLAGARMLAHFDCEVHGIVLYGCALVKTAKGGFIANAPRIEGLNGRSRAVAIVDHRLRHAVMAAARDVYRMMRGTEVEWQLRARENEGEAIMDAPSVA